MNLLVPASLLVLGLVLAGCGDAPSSEAPPATTTTTPTTAQPTAGEGAAAPPPDHVPPPMAPEPTPEPTAAPVPCSEAPTKEKYLPASLGPSARTVELKTEPARLACGATFVVTYGYNAAEAAALPEAPAMDVAFATDDGSVFWMPEATVTSVNDRYVFTRESVEPGIPHERTARYRIAVELPADATQVVDLSMTVTYVPAS